MKKGFTLIEVLVGAAVFLVIALAMYGAYTRLFTLISLNQYKILALNLANEQFEIIRNLSYADVGEIGGIPNGKIAHTQVLNRGGVNFTVTTTIRNIDLPFDGTLGGSPNDLSPADNKLIEVRVDCASCVSYTPITLTTTVAPKNLETASTNGALFVKVFDANGKAVQGASVHIVNAAKGITVDDVTDANGMLQVVDVPPGVNAYSIVVTKGGYSSARTYPPGGSGNPSPSQPDATVVIQQVTQVSFAIDKLSTLSVSSLTSACSPVAGMDFNLTGSKMIGSNVSKYSQNLATDVAGSYSSGSIEWDSYTLSGIDSAYDIIGINPLNPFSVNPNSNQHVDLITQPKAPKTLLITVKDASTGLPISDATVVFNGVTKITDRGYVNQSDWSGGSGQDTYTDTTKYLNNDGNIETNSPAGEIKLKNAFGTYNSNGVLESSTIDTGSNNNFNTISWLPTDQPIAAGTDSVKFQLATNKEITSTTTWDYKGPDGTGSTYYTLSTTTISAAHNGDRFVRYKVFLSTATATSTPNISDISFTYSSLCEPPGQVVFSGLSSGTYTLTISKPGYTTFQDTGVAVSSNWAEKIVTLTQ